MMRTNIQTQPGGLPIQQVNGVATSQQTLTEPADESKKPSVTLQGVLNILDEFRCGAIITAGGFRVSGALGRSSINAATNTSTNAATNAATYTSAGEFHSLFEQTVFVELIYGGVGILVLSTLFFYACVSGRISEEGCGPALRDTVGGNNYLHFLASVLSTAAGVFGAVGLYSEEVKEHYLQLSVILTLFSKTLVMGSKAKQARKKDGVVGVQSGDGGSNLIALDALGREHIQHHLADQGSESTHTQQSASQVVEMPDDEAEVVNRTAQRRSHSPQMFVVVPDGNRQSRTVAQVPSSAPDLQ